MLGRIRTGSTHSGSLMPLFLAATDCNEHARHIMVEEVFQLRLLLHTQVSQKHYLVPQDEGGVAVAQLQLCDPNLHLCHMPLPGETHVDVVGVLRWQMRRERGKF